MGTFARILLLTISINWEKISLIRICSDKNPLLTGLSLNITHSTVEVNILWSGISLGYCIDLHIYRGGSVMAVRCPDEVLDPIVKLYTAAVDLYFRSNEQ